MSNNLLSAHEIELYEKQKQLKADVDNASQCINTLTKGYRYQNGFVPDTVRNTPEYQSARREYNIAFEALRQFNKSVPPALKRKWSQVRRSQA